MKAVNEKKRGKREESQGREIKAAGELPTSSCSSQSHQQHLDHFPAWPHLILTLCRQSRAHPWLPENVAVLGFLFLIWTPHEVCNQLLMALPWYNSFLSPLVLIAKHWIYPTLLKPALRRLSYHRDSLYAAGRNAFKAHPGISADSRFHCSALRCCGCSVKLLLKGGGSGSTSGRAGMGFYVRQMEWDLATSCPAILQLLRLQLRITKSFRDGKIPSKS